MIEFLPAKRRFAGLSGGDGGFRLETLNPTTTDPNSSGGSREGVDSLGKRSSGVQSMELGLDPELSFKFTMRRIGAGLENLGNTCFLNSVLQCLTYTEPLAAYLQSGKHKSSCRKAGFCALCAIQNHVSRALQATGRSLAPKDLVSNLRCISRNFRNARQEDAHEYMVNLLESMHKCCLPSGVPSESPSAFEKSLVHKIFGGRLRSQVKCMQCSFCSDKFDPFLDLSLEIDEADSLQKALSHFTAKEYLDGGAKEYQCQKCKQKVKALKQLSIHQAPYVLSIHLKRFGCHRPGQKINKKVHFGPTLDLKPFVTGAYDGDLKYTLYGVLVHYGGNTHSGHYSSFVRTSSGMWYSLDDHRVYNVSEKKVLDEKAYMLFYVRTRKNITPKKPVDVHGKSMIIGAMENRIKSDSNQVFKKTFQNGLTCASKEALIKGKAIQVTVEETVAECSSLRKEIQFDTSSVNEMVNDINDCVEMVNENIESNCPQDSIAVKNSEKVEKDVSSSIVIKPECHVTRYSSVESVPLKGCDEIESKISNPSSQVDEPSNVDLQIGDPSKERTDGDNAKDMEIEPSKPSRIEAATVIPSSSESIGLKSQRKQKKKSSKSQITMTRLSSGIILGATLGIRKKKHKKVKRTLKIKNLNQENLGPSTSEPIKVKSQKKQSKSRSSKSKKIISNAKSMEDGLVDNGADVAKDKSPKCISSSHLARENTGLKDTRSDSIQNGIMKMLTRGMESPIVPQWDEIKHSSSHITEISGKETISIGYIGDDWDQEYDKGKRKKVKTSIKDFNGPNLFQEMATKEQKVKFKKAKRDRSSSANQPFRI